jgi:hypothetical protein
MLLTILIFLSQLAFADRPDGGEFHEPHHATCDAGRVLACVAHEQQAFNVDNGAAAAYNAQIAELDLQLPEAKLASDDAEAEEKKFVEEETALSSEIEFLAAPAAPTAKEIFPGFPPVEDFFGLTSLEKSWGGQYSAPLRQKLIEVLNSAKELHAAAHPNNQLAIAKFSDLTKQRTQFVDARNAAMYRVAQHVHMLNGGCHDVTCPPTEP